MPGAGTGVASKRGEVDFEPARAGWPVGVDTALGEHELDARAVEQVVEALAGHVAVDRDVDAAGLQDRDGRDDLLPALAHDDADTLAGQRAARE